MGYTVELWAAAPGAVLGALTHPTAGPPAGLMNEDVRDAWSELAPVVAQALTNGGGRLVAEYGNYVASVIRRVGHHYGSLDHTSSGGDEFRRRFLSQVAASRYGRDAVAALIGRPLGGLTWEEYPQLGHLSVPEVTAAAERAAVGPEVDDHPEDLSSLRTLDRALIRSARHGLELHAIYA